MLRGGPSVITPPRIWRCARLLGDRIHRVNPATSKKLSGVHTPHCMPDMPPRGDSRFEVLGEEKVFQRYLTLYNRRIKFPTSGRGHEDVHEFDVVGHPKCDFHFCLTFPFHPAAEGTQHEVTLVREYCQGVNSLGYSLPAGGFDPRKHGSKEECARAELSEEALLMGGKWVQMLDPAHPGVPEVKWCANRFTPFLCIQPEADTQPGQRDHEEFIQVLRVSIPELRRIMRSGDMMLPSVVTCYWALDELRDMGYQL